MKLLKCTFPVTTKVILLYALGFEPAIDSVKAYIKDMENILTTGRQGGFTYPNMHNAMRMGADAAQTIAKAFPAS